MIWTQQLSDAMRAVSLEGGDEDVTLRAREITRIPLRIGEPINDRQHSFLIATIQRLDQSYDPKARASHLALDQAWREASR